MYVCPHCSAENRHNANFCRDCGTARDQREPAVDEQVAKCPCCTRRVRHADRYCMACGEKLGRRLHRETKLCLSCKTLLPMQAAFCFSCGEYVAASSSNKITLSDEPFSDDNCDLTPRYDV